jgi:hypothetical protein
VRKTNSAKFALPVLFISLIAGTTVLEMARANWVILPTSPNTDLPALTVRSPIDGGVYSNETWLNITVVKPTSWNQTQYDPNVIAGISYIYYTLDGKTDSIFETQFYNPIPNDLLPDVANFSVALRGLSSGMHSVRVFVFAETQYCPTKGPFGDAMPPFYEYNATVGSETIRFNIENAPASPSPKATPNNTAAQSFRPTVLPTSTQAPSSLTSPSPTVPEMGTKKVIFAMITALITTVFIVLKIKLSKPQRSN